MKAVWLLFFVLATLPAFNPKPVNRLASPNKRFVATINQDRKLIFVEEKSALKAHMHGHYDNLDRGRGVYQLSWSPDSKLLAYDFLINHSTKYIMDGFSFIGVMNVSNGSVWILSERGCNPRFVNGETIDFLSSREKLSDGTRGEPSYVTETETLYRHRIKLKKPDGTRKSLLVYRNGEKIDYLELESKLADQISPAAQTARTVSTTLATYTNRRFGFQVSYPKGWKISRSQNGDGFNAVYKKQELRAAASFLGTVNEQEKSVPLKQMINYWEPELKIWKTVDCTVPDSYKGKPREALIGYYSKKFDNVIQLISRDENIQYNVWATNIPETTALKLFKTFKITEGEEKS